MFGYQSAGTIVIILMGLVLWLSSYSVIGPAYLSYAEPGVLERVAEKRIRLGWGLERLDMSRYDALVATEDCLFIGREGWLLTELSTDRVLVVDCQNRDEQPRMSDVNLLADINVKDLVHEKGVLLLR